MADTRILEIILRARDEASKTLEKASGNITGSMKKAEEGSKMFAAGLLAVGAAAAGFIGYGAKIAGDLEASRQGFITLLGSAEKADETIAQVKKDAASTPFELPGLIAANQMLTAVTKNGQKSEKLLMNVGKALSAMGRGQPELDRIIVNLQQIGSLGKASTLDIKQFAFAGIPIYNMLTEATGKSGEALADMITNGEITFEVLEEMFNKAGSAGGQFEKAFSNQAGGFNQLVSNMKDSFGIFMSDLARSTGVFDVLKQGMAGLITFMNEHGDDIGKGIVRFLDFVQANGPIIAGIIIGGLVPAFFALAAGIWAAMVPLIPFMIAGAAVGLVAKVIIDNWEPISGFFVGLWSRVTTATQAGVNFLTVTVPAMIEQVVTWFATLPGRVWAFYYDLYFVKIPYAVGYAAGFLATAIPQMVSNIVTWFSSLPDRVAEIFERVRSAVVSKVQQASGWLSGELSAWPGRVSAFLSAIPGRVSQVFSDAKYAAIDQVHELWRQLTGWWDRIKGVIDSIRNAASDAIGKVREGFQAGRNAGMSFADGGWVPYTGNAKVHAGEFVLSHDMLEGRKPIPQGVVNNQNDSNITVGPVYVQGTADVDTMAQRLGFYLQTAGNL